MQTVNKPKRTRERIHDVLWTATAKQADKAREQIQPEHRLFQDLGVDSLGAVEITMEVEVELDISIPDDLMENADITMGQLEAALCQRLLE